MSLFFSIPITVIGVVAVLGIYMFSRKNKKLYSSIPSLKILLGRGTSRYKTIV